MKRIKWTFIPDYRASEYLDHIDLIVCYSGKRYVALNVRHLTISTIQFQAPGMIKALKEDMRHERNGRSLRKMRGTTARRRH